MVLGFNYFYALLMACYFRDTIVELMVYFIGEFSYPFGNLYTVPFALEAIVCLWLEFDSFIYFLQTAAEHVSYSPIGFYYYF